MQTKSKKELLIDDDIHLACMIKYHSKRSMQDLKNLSLDLWAENELEQFIFYIFFLLLMEVLFRVFACILGLDFDFCRRRLIEGVCLLKLFQLGLGLKNEVFIKRVLIAEKFSI